MCSIVFQKTAGDISQEIFAILAPDINSSYNYYFFANDSLSACRYILLKAYGVDSSGNYIHNKNTSGGALLGSGRKKTCVYIKGLQQMIGGGKKYVNNKKHGNNKKTRKKK